METEMENESEPTNLEPSEKTNWRKFFLRIFISTGILTFSVVTAILVSQSKSPDAVQNIEDVIPTVKTEHVSEETNGISFQVDGVVVPFREVVIASEVSGNLCFLAPECRLGRYVKKGDVLVEIDKKDYTHALEEAQQTQIQAVRAIEEWKVSVENNAEEVKIASAQYDMQKLERDRCCKLYDKGAVSETEKETADLNLLTKKEALVNLMNTGKTLRSQQERLVSSQESAKIAVEKAQLNLDRCTIHAPLSGLVVVLSVEQDKFVQRGETLVTIHDTARLEVQCSLYMKQVEWLWSERLAREAKTLGSKNREIRCQNENLPPLEASNVQDSTLVQNSVSVKNTADSADSSTFVTPLILSTSSSSATVQDSAEPQITAVSQNVEIPETLRMFYQFDDTPVRVTCVLDGTMYQWKGVLTYLDGPGLDSRTRMLPCRVVVENPLNGQALNEDGTLMDGATFRALMPGMFVMVHVHATPNRELLNLSEMAVLPGGTVWKIHRETDGRCKLIRATKITTAYSDTNTGRVIVYEKKGVLDAGDEVVVSPLATPLEGTFVNVLKEATP